MKHNTRIKDVNRVNIFFPSPTSNLARDIIAATALFGMIMIGACLVVLVLP